jgi:hypothetical protein
VRHGGRGLRRARENRVRDQYTTPLSP